ncbi:SusC/RagA family TonB-linked outer membrane protein [Mucilaginibacter gossypii]|uniref:TonB-linked outer membrane protein, SusC/RagA family n=1 Tax=Mucilaginibacter gossypii TaxID=551996 RepID=A0A1G7PIV9_9SPHI|nr:TonB-dependent receptor [Mucilaginibacter gossypii]SDF86236.1 TonB-linked outer membrane protein, SusC/RagA family [Mucilaginibacter gossypii]
MRKLLLFVVLFSAGLISAYAQQRKITGTVKDSQSGQTLPFATISIISNGKTISKSAADRAGKFSVDAETGMIIQVSFAGYEPARITLAASSDLTVPLKSNTNLSEVVVIAYGREKRKDLTSAVTTVTAQQLSEAPSTNLATALGSRVPGLEVHATSTQPGSGASVNVRGLNSISQLQGPLYIVDGVALVGDIRNINPNDIESVEILKDAAAAGIYGSRAAEGVILITTKKPKAGATNVNFDMYAGIQHNNPAYQMLGAHDYATLKRLAYQDADPGTFGQPGTTTADAKIFNANELQSIVDGYTGYDWQKAILHNNALTQNYTLSVANGTGSNKVYFSGQYQNQDGILINTGYKKYSGYLSDETAIRSFLKLGGSMNFTHDITHNAMPNEYQQSLTQSPLQPIYDSSGQPLITVDNSTGVPTIFNPVTLALNAIDLYTTNRTNANLFVEFTPVKNLMFRSSIGADIYQAEEDKYWPRTTGPGYAPTNGLGEIYNTRATDVLWENTATYNLTKGNHDLSLLGGFTFERHENTATDMQGSQFPTDLLSYKAIGSAGQKLQDNSNYDGWAVRSFFGRAVYKFKGRYILNGTIRQDGSSRFGGNNKFGVFPTVSGAWRVIDEPWIGFKLKTWLSDFKLRASYGLVGNQNLPYDAIYTRYDPTTYPFNGTSVTSGYLAGGTNGVFGNNSLQWEVQHQFNAGTDIAMFDNRIQLSLDVYNKNISSLLMPLPLAPSSGFQTEYVNVAAMRTRGIDVALKTTPVKTASFTWQAQINWSKYDSKVTKLFPGRDSVNLYLRVGLPPAGTFVNYIFDGLYQQGDNFKLNPNGKPGDIKIRDVNGDGKITPLDQVVVGSSIPKGSGNFWNYFRYKAISLTVNSTFAYGQKLNNLTFTNLTYYNSAFGSQGNVTVQGGDYWTPTNTNTVIPRPNSFGTSLKTLPGGISQGSSYSIQNASYLRIQHITLGYDLPSSLLKKIKVNTLNIYAQALNPFVFTSYKGIDPDIAGNYASNEIYPRYRTFILGARLSL